MKVMPPRVVIAPPEKGTPIVTGRWERMPSGPVSVAVFSEDVLLALDKIWPSPGQAPRAYAW